jgi:hypothetical protein
MVNDPGSTFSRSCSNAQALTAPWYVSSSTGPGRADQFCPGLEPGSALCCLFLGRRHEDSLEAHHHRCHDQRQTQSFALGYRVGSKAATYRTSTDLIYCSRSIMLPSDSVSISSVIFPHV